MKIYKSFLQMPMIIVFLLEFFAFYASAQWSHDPNINTPICTASKNQVRPAIVSDGAGGAIIVWNDYRYGQSTPFDKSDVFAQRLNASGITQWTANGVTISIASSSSPITPIPPALVSDGAGGAITAWHDFRNNKWTIYAQRINSYGIVQWRSNGIAVSLPSGVGPWVQFPPAFISDSTGGAILAWEDYREGKARLFAQRINGSGVLLWDSTGVAVCDTLSAVLSGVVLPVLVGDGTGGAIIAWTDELSGPSYHIRAQRINGTGMVQWASNGIAITPVSLYQAGLALGSDGTGGAIVTWVDNISGNANLHAQRLNSSGITPWGPDGIVLSATGGGQSVHSIESGDVIIAWSDSRNGTNSDIYAQCIDTAGESKWNKDGIAVSAAAYNEIRPTIISDSTDGAIIAWKGVNEDCYAQKINDSGVVQWPSNGVLLCNSSDNRFTPIIASDGAGGAIVTWEDFRNGYDNADIYSQQVSVNGDLGVVSTNVIETDARPSVFQLYQNYPNPFNPSTTISFDLPSKTFVSLKVFNLLGEEVATIVSDELTAGHYSKQWSTVGMPSGVYFYRLQAGTYTVTKRMVLLK